MLKDSGTSPSREMGKLVVIVHCPFSHALLHYGIISPGLPLERAFFLPPIFFFRMALWGGKMTAEYQRQTEWTTQMLKDVLDTKSHILLGIHR